ncbi:MAG TPA: dihydroxyacetone kinase subunit DhaK [Hypericibacter adhaerens]|jgi:dihydroxyacetone kinase-like protein|uniref:phosphoenolpyruvate--glycerone phosphotransferase n=1 Tax=Hypericibacter adhaerens TaxID=2602016 RepID=A0A5J6N271_9PROT|nr:dihydroxyacetone kinase subunit DhaK [Hypericibacter adhaerens]QEX23053.1 dihydroxyacetone kinase subunit DhaK [Hypericibacter adhaerens]HWA44216.1 dihydroxyacetone kinase subunit DhaK [Hypericibacter adhaerens]
MKKFINAVDRVLTESLRGFGAAHSDIVRVQMEPTFVARADAPVKGKVALISGGGSGHEPLHAGFVGRGMLDAACPGQVFTSCTPDQMAAAAQAVDGGAGVLFIVKNYAGDVMNFEMAADMIGGDQATVITNDDVAVEDSTYTTGRRGVAGTVVVEKMVGAAADKGADLAACKALGERVNKATRSMGVALTSCTVPAAGRPTFQLGEDEIEMGVGIHGEPGRKRVKLESADAIANTLMHAIETDLKPKAGAPALLLVNGFGGTPLMELYLMYDAARRYCEGRNIKVARSLVGNYTTSLEMAGCSLTLTALDDELTKLWDHPVRTAALRWGV